MAKTTIKSLQEQIAKYEKLVKVQDKVIAKSTQEVEKVGIKLSKTAWQTLSGHYGNQVSLAPFSEGGKFKTPAVTVRMTQPATKTGFDQARAYLDLAEQKLEDSGILTA